ncbi:hypothetical protein LG293_17470 (plasmid) [Citricoccus nitrophenolicus]
MSTTLFGQRDADVRVALECGHRQAVKSGARSAWCPICLNQVPVQES